MVSVGFNDSMFVVEPNDLENLEKVYKRQKESFFVAFQN